MTRLAPEDIKSFLLDQFAPWIEASGLDAGAIGDDLDLLDAGIIDSLGILEMIEAVKEHFEIAVDFEPMDPVDLTKLGRFCVFVARNAKDWEARP